MEADRVSLTFSNINKSFVGAFKKAYNCRIFDELSFALSKCHVANFYMICTIWSRHSACFRNSQIEGKLCNWEVERA